MSASPTIRRFSSRTGCTSSPLRARSIRGSMLRLADQEYLQRTGLEHEVTPEAGLVSLVIKAWPLPDGYEPREVDLLIRLPAGFPDTQPDMYWCDPPVRSVRTGGYPQAADQFEQHLGR